MRRVASFYFLPQIFLLTDLVVRKFIFRADTAANLSRESPDQDGYQLAIKENDKMRINVCLNKLVGRLRKMRVKKIALKHC